MKTGKQVQEQVERFASSLLGELCKVGKNVEAFVEKQFSLENFSVAAYQRLVKMGFPSKEARRMVVKLVNQAMDKVEKEGSE